MKGDSASEAKVVINRIYNSLQNFIKKHQDLFSDQDAAKVFTGVFSERHKQLREQLAEIILPVCGESKAENRIFLAQFLAEALLTWTVEGKTIEELSPIFSLLL